MTKGLDCHLNIKWQKGSIDKVVSYLDQNRTNVIVSRELFL